LVVILTIFNRRIFLDQRQALCHIAQNLCGLKLAAKQASKQAKMLTNITRNGYETYTNGIEKYFSIAKSVHFCSSDERFSGAVLLPERRSGCGITSNYLPG
jgi:hypothetical protein